MFDDQKTFHLKALIAHCWQSHIAQWHFSEQPNKLLSIEWNKLIADLDGNEEKDEAEDQDLDVAPDVPGGRRQRQQDRMRHLAAKK